MSRRTLTPSTTRRKTSCGPRTRTRLAGPTWPTATPSRPACRGCHPRAWTRLSPSPATAGCGRISATATSPSNRRRSAPQFRSSPSPSPMTRARYACASPRMPARRHVFISRRTHPSGEESPAQGPDLPTAALRALPRGRPVRPIRNRRRRHLVEQTRLRNNLRETGGKRTVELLVAPPARSLHARRRNPAGTPTKTV